MRQSYQDDQFISLGLTQKLLNKFTIVDVTILVKAVCENLLNGINVGRVKLSNCGYQLRPRTLVAVIAVKHLECLCILVLFLGLFHVVRHECDELCEVNDPVLILIHCIDHLLQLSLRHILAE